MKKILLIPVVLLTGCMASFQPFPAYSKAEINQAFQLRDENIKILAEAMAKLNTTKNIGDGLAAMGAMSKKEDEK